HRTAKDQHHTSPPTGALDNLDVALLVGDLLLVPGGERVRARAEHLDAERIGDLADQIERLGQVVGHFADRVAHAGDDLDRVEQQLLLDLGVLLSSRFGDLGEDLFGDRGEFSGTPLHQGQLPLGSHGGSAGRGEIDPHDSYTCAPVDGSEPGGRLSSRARSSARPRPTASARMPSGVASPGPIPITPGAISSTRPMAKSNAMTTIARVGRGSGGGSGGTKCSSASSSSAWSDSMASSQPTALVRHSDDGRAAGSSCSRSRGRGDSAVSWVPNPSARNSATSSSKMASTSSWPSGLFPVLLTPPSSHGHAGDGTMIDGAVASSAGLSLSPAAHRALS